MAILERKATSGDVARALGLSTASVQGYARQGRIPCRLTPGGHYRFNIDEVVSLLSPDLLSFSDDLVGLGFGSDVRVDELSGFRADPVTPAAESRLRMRALRREGSLRASEFDQSEGAAELDQYIRQAGGAALAVLRR